MWAPDSYPVCVVLSQEHPGRWEEKETFFVNTHRHVKMHKMGIPGPLWAETSLMMRKEVEELKCVLDGKLEPVTRGQTDLAWS